MKDGTVDGQYAKAIVVRYVTYSTPHGHVMRCTLRTFRRWIYSHEAARAQKTRRRELKLSRH